MSATHTAHREGSCDRRSGCRGYTRRSADSHGDNGSGRDSSNSSGSDRRRGGGSGKNSSGGRN